MKPSLMNLLFIVTWNQMTEGLKDEECKTKKQQILLLFILTSCSAALKITPILLMFTDSDRQLSTAVTLKCVSF